MGIDERVLIFSDRILWRWKGDNPWHEGVVTETYDNLVRIGVHAGVKIGTWACINDIDYKLRKG